MLPCFLSLSDHERVCACETLENMDILGLLQRQMKWPASGGGQSSVEENENTKAGMVFTQQSRFVAGIM